MNANKLINQAKNNLPLIFICFFGAVLRFHKLGTLIFHLDEPIHSIQVAAKSLLFNVTHDYGSVLYQVILHFILPLGKLEFISRLPAALFGILTIFGTYYAGKLFFGKNIGLTAALFVSFSPYLLRYSQYARGYTILTFLSLLSLIFFYKALKGNQTKDWILFVVFSAVNAYTHQISLMTIAIYSVFIGTLLVEKWLGLNKKKTWQIDSRRLIHFSLSILAIIGIAFFLSLPVGKMDGDIKSVNWIANTLGRLLAEPTIGFFPLVKQILTHHISQSPPLHYLLALFFIFFGFIGCLIRLRRKDILLLLYIVFPFFAFYLIKPLPLFYMGADRYFIFILPVVFIVMARGIDFLSSLLFSMISFLKGIKKKEYVLRNLVPAVLILFFFLLECISIKGYSDYAWKLRSLHISKRVSRFLKDNIEDSDLIFFNSYPNKTNILNVSPLYLKGEKKRVLLYTYEIRYLQQNSNRGVWLVLDRSLLRQEETDNINSSLNGAALFEIEGHSIIHWESGEKILLNNLIDMSEFLISLNTDKEEDNRLLLAYFHLLDRNLEESLKELDIVEENRSLASEVKIENFQNFRDIATNSLYSNIGRLLWDLGYNLISEEKFDDGTAAFDMCLQLSDEYREPISQQYFTLGNQFLRLKNPDKAIYFLKKAIEINSQNYFFHFILAEAYWQKGAEPEAISEYRIGFNNPFLSDEFIHKVISKPELFAIWYEKNTWHFLWRSDKKSIFSGRLYFDKRMGAIQKYHLSKKDVFNRSKDYAAEFELSTNDRQIKTVEINTGKKTQLTCYVKMNDRMVTEEIIFINSGENPIDIPFTISSDRKVGTVPTFRFR